MLGVGGLVGDPDRHPGDAGREEIDAGMQRVGDEREAADREADDKLRRRKDQARGERNGGGAFLQRHRPSAIGPRAFLEAKRRIRPAPAESSLPPASRSGMITRS